MWEAEKVQVANQQPSYEKSTTSSSENPVIKSFKVSSSVFVSITVKFARYLNV